MNKKPREPKPKNQGERDETKIGKAKGKAKEAKFRKT